MRGRTILGAVSLMVASASLTMNLAEAGTLYRWNDDRGNPVISDRPPPIGVPYTTLDGARYGISASSSIKSPKPMPTPKAESVKAGSPGAGAIIDEQPRNAKASKETCDQVAADIDRLETFARIRTQDTETGEIYFLSESEKASRLAQAKEFLESNCD